MTREPAEAAPAAPDRLDWSGIDLVVFDLDGTLYEQRKLRLRMLGLLVWDALATGSLKTLRVLRHYRRCRERLGDGGGDFVDRQFALPAQRCGVSADEVRVRVEDWISRRPLAHLERCRTPGADALFKALRSSGRTIAVLSDYPAEAKLAALGLRADLVVSAEDPDVRRLKPDPRGLDKILRLTGTPPSRAVMIGDRRDRDGAVARRSGVAALIKNEPDGYVTFEDAVFRPLLASDARLAAAADISRPVYGP